MSERFAPTAHPLLPTGAAYRELAEKCGDVALARASRPHSGQPYHYGRIVTRIVSGNARPNAPGRLHGRRRTRLDGVPIVSEIEYGRHGYRERIFGRPRCRPIGQDTELDRNGSRSIAAFTPSLNAPSISRVGGSSRRH